MVFAAIYHLLLHHNFHYIQKYLVLLLVIAYSSKLVKLTIKDEAGFIPSFLQAVKMFL
jgi:hypothetical protein